MKRIGVTQRVELILGYDERRDCLDQRWASLLDAAGLSILPIPNGLTNVEAWAESQALDGLLLTGGNDLSHLPGATNVAPERDRTEALLLRWAEERRVPVFAVCRGMQMMHCWLGGRLERVEEHVARRHVIVVATGCDLLDGRNESSVNSFHGWGIPRTSLVQGVSELAWSKDGYVEAFLHTTLPWLGIMWHPERETPFFAGDVNLLRSHFSA